MPLYEYTCKECGAAQTAYRKVDDRHNGPECHGVMALTISPVRGFVENIRYQSPIDNRAITSKRQRADDLARSGCRPWEGLDQEKKQAARDKLHEQKNFEQKVEKWVGEAYQSLPTEKKRILEQQ